MILMNNFKSEPEELIFEEITAVERVIRSGAYILGDEVKKFEELWAQYCGVGSAVGVGNGMDAIEIGLKTIGIGRGDEVITTAMTAFATVVAIIRSGATPVFADVNLDTALLNPESVERCISDKTKAVLLVHLYGQILDMDRWEALCNKHHIFLLEDCAQAHLASWEGKVAGAFGRWGAYSFYPTKNLGTLGDGGMLVMNVDEDAKQAKVLRNYGQVDRYHHSMIGGNSRLDELHAALLSVRVKWLKEFTIRRQTIAKTYHNGIVNPKVRLLAKPPNENCHVYHLFVLQCSQRDELSTFLREQGISSLIHYPIPAHQQPPCQGMKQDPQGLGFTEQHATECLSIPIHPNLSAQDVQHIVDIINQF